MDFSLAVADALVRRLDGIVWDAPDRLLAANLRRSATPNYGHRVRLEPGAGMKMIDLAVSMNGTVAQVAARGRLDRISVNLIEPNSLGVLGETLTSWVCEYLRQAAADRFPIETEFAIVNATVQQRLLALKAFWVVEQARRKDRIDLSRKLVHDFLGRLELASATPRIIKRRMFYTMVLLGWNRKRAYYKQAQQLGEQFASFGGYSPLAPWERIMAAARKFRPEWRSEPVGWLDFVRASRLALTEAERYDHFLQKLSLEDLARYQGLLR